MKKMNFYSLVISILFFLGALSTGNLLAQAVSFNSVGTPTGGSCVDNTTTFMLNGMTVNAGNNRMVVILAGANSNVTVNGNPTSSISTTTFGLTGAAAFDLVFYPLGSGGATTINIVFTCPGPSSGTGFVPFVFDNVDQTNPILNAAGIDALAGTGTNSTLTVPGVSPDDLIFDHIQIVIGSAMLNAGQPVVSAGQTVARPTMPFSTTDNIFNSYKVATGTSESMGWSWAPTFPYLHIAIGIRGINSTATGGVGLVTATNNTIVPTMSQWGLVIFGLLLLNLGVFYTRKKILL